jgi:lipoprotein-releasing system ATP-binding protein
MRQDMTHTPVLIANNISRRFHEGPLDVTVLQNVDLSVNAGETLAMCWVAWTSQALAACR